MTMTAERPAQDTLLNDALANLEIGLQEMAQAAECSPATLDRLFSQGKLGGLGRNAGAGSKARLKFRVGDLEAIKAAVERDRTAPAKRTPKNGEVIMHKLDALARAINVLVNDESNESISPDTTNRVNALLAVGGFDLTVEGEA